MYFMSSYFMYGLMVGNFYVLWEQILFKFVLRKSCWKGGQIEVLWRELLSVGVVTILGQLRL